MEKNIDENFIMENIGQLNQQLGQQTSSTPAIPSQVQFNLQPQIKQIPANINVNNGPRMAPPQSRGPFIPQNQMNQVNQVSVPVNNGNNSGTVACTVDPSCFQIFGFQLSKKTVYILIALIVLAAVYYWWVRSKKIATPPMIMDKKREKKDKKSKDKKEESEKSESSSSSESKKSKSSK